MKIKFKEMEAATIPHFKGGEGDFIAKCILTISTRSSTEDCSRDAR